MKVHFSIITLVILLISCSSPEQKAKKAIKEYLKYTLNDFKSYEPVSFGKIEVAYSNYEDSPIVKQYFDEAEKFLEKAKENNEEADNWGYEHTIIRDSYRKQANEALDRADKIMQKVDSIKLHFVPTVIGQKMTHMFRARIPAGGYKLNDYIFYFDKEFSKVTKSIDLSE